MRFINKLNGILAEDANSFANSFGLPRISPWIVQQYNKGHQSYKDYEEIVQWVTNNNPNIDEYDFHSALVQAKSFCNNARKTGFDPYVDLQSKNKILELENGKYWLSIGPEDCNAICHRLKYDCSNELKGVIDSKYNCYALQDPQDNTLCIFLDCEPCKIIGQFGNGVSGYHEEIKRLCIRKGLKPVPESYSNLELVRALASKELNIDDVYDISAIMKRLSANDIINCNLINYAHYSTIKSIYDLYNKTNHDCLLIYAICYLIIYGYTNSNAYNIVKGSVLSNQEVSKIINTGKTDNRYLIGLMDKSASEISKLER